MIQELLQIIVDIFYPIRCLNCHKEIADRGVLCPVCGAMLQDARFFRREDFGCPYLDGIFMFYRYEKAVREALLEAKFYHKKVYVGRLAAEQEKVDYGRLAGKWALPENVLVTPIPTDKQRAKARGFDLPEEIFREWCAKNQLEWKLCLSRVKPSQPQYGLNKQQRKENVAGCWEVCRSVNRRHILLADDIFTTGATMNEGARCLKEAGAAKVYAMALAGGKT